MNGEDIRASDNRPTLAEYCAAMIATLDETIEELERERMSRRSDDRDRERVKHADEWAASSRT